MTTVYGTSTVKRVRRSKFELAEVDDAIVAAVAEDHPVSLRGVFYRVESAGAVAKSDSGYRVVGRRLLALRRSGRVPYSHITDGTRWITRPRTWSDLDAMLDDAAASYRRMLWHNQPSEVLLFTEKDAISGAILPVTEKWDVPLGVIRGYASESFAHSVADSIIRSNVARSGITHVYQLGDHDPSGLDAWRDFQDKVLAFITERRGDLASYVVFERLAVTTGQITTLGLPTRPTKAKDARARNFTGGSVEVDAIRAPVLREIVENAITGHIDDGQLEVTLAVEAEERRTFANMVAAKRGGAS